MTKPLWSGSESSTATGRFSKKNITNDFIACGKTIFKGLYHHVADRPQLNNVLGSASIFTLRYFL